MVSSPVSVEGKATIHSCTLGTRVSAPPSHLAASWGSVLLDNRMGTVSLWVKRGTTVQLRLQITLASCSARASSGACMHSHAVARGCSSVPQRSVAQTGLVGDRWARVPHMKPPSHLRHFIGRLVKRMFSLTLNHSQKRGGSPKPPTFQVFKKKKGLKSIFISSSHHEKMIAWPSQYMGKSF